MNVEIGTEAAQFPEKEYINGIFFAVYSPNIQNAPRTSNLIRKKRIELKILIYYDASKVIKAYWTSTRQLQI